MPQIDMPYFVGERPAAFLLGRAFVIADYKIVVSFAPKSETVLVIVGLQIFNVPLNPYRKFGIAVNPPAVLQSNIKRINGKCGYALIEQKPHCGYVVNVFIYIPSFPPPLSSSPGGALSYKAAASARPETSPPRAA